MLESPKEAFLFGERMRPLINYFRDSFTEFGKINWPTRTQTIRLTIAVMIFSTVISIFMFLIDLGLNELVKRFLVGE